MRKHPRVDSNQAQIVAALRSVGASVSSLASLGCGCPDLLVGHQGRNYLMEVKDGNKYPSQRRLTSDEQRWHQAWRDQVATINTVDEAIALLRSNPINLEVSHGEDDS